MRIHYEEKSLCYLLSVDAADNAAFASAAGGVAAGEAVGLRDAAAATGIEPHCGKEQNLYCKTCSSMVLSRLHRIELSNPTELARREQSYYSPAMYVAE